MYINMPSDVECIINELEKAGFEAYIVGGCVRDSILGVSPGDWDITTSATPQEVKEIFKYTVDTGIKHGTVSVIRNKVNYEITTYRIDGAYSDGRHPDKVEFSTDLEEDLKRRDFTINAMAYSHKSGLIDLFGGIKDLEHKLINCVGKPEERFSEDALRMLRAVRFAAQLEFTIDRDTFNAIRILAGNLSKVSKERIWVEINKTLCSANPHYIKLIYEGGLQEGISLGFKEIYIRDMEDLLHLYKRYVDRHIAWSVLLRSLDIQKATGILKELRSDNDTIQRVKAILKFISIELKTDKKLLRKILSEIGFDRLRDIVYIKKNNIAVTKEERVALEDIIKLIYEIEESKDPISMDMLDIDGVALMKLGVPKGRDIGYILKSLLESVIEEPELNSQKILLSMAEELYKTIEIN